MKREHNRHESEKYFRLGMASNDCGSLVEVSWNTDRIFRYKGCPQENKTHKYLNHTNDCTLPHKIRVEMAQRGIVPQEMSTGEGQKWCRSTGLQYCGSRSNFLSIKKTWS